MTLYVAEQVRKCTGSVKIVVPSLWYCLCKILNLWMLISTAVTKYTSSVTAVFILFYSCYFFSAFLGSHHRQFESTKGQFRYSLLG